MIRPPVNIPPTGSWATDVLPAMIILMTTMTDASVPTWLAGVNLLFILLLCFQRDVARPRDADWMWLVDERRTYNDLLEMGLRP